MRAMLLMGALCAAGCSEINGPQSDIDEKPRFGAGDALDVGTTAIGLAEGFSEANPILAECGPAAPVCGAILKPAVKYALVEGAGMDPREANIGIEQAGWMAGCANIMTISGAAPPVAVVVGVTCGVAYLADQGVIPEHKREHGKKGKE